MVVNADPPNNEGVAVVTDMTKDLRLAAELGTTLLNANEGLRQQLREALERERDLIELIADLRRKLATSDEEILTLSAELAELQESTSSFPVEGRTSRIEKSLQAVLSTIHDNQQQLKLERKSIADQAEAIRARESERCRDIEAIRMHCFELESRVDTMSMANALMVLKAHARLRRLEQELNDTKLKLLERETELEKRQSAFSNCAQREQGKEKPHSIECSKNDGPSVPLNHAEYLDTVDDRMGNNVLLDFFFMTAMSCKIDLVERGLSTAAFTITNEELFERLEKEANPIPFYQWYHWIRDRLSVKLVAESDEMSNVTSHEVSWLYNRLWKFLWRR